MISTRCCTPTGRSSTSASGSTARPYCSDRSRMRAAAARRSRAVVITRNGRIGSGGKEEGQEDEQRNPTARAAQEQGQDHKEGDS